MRGDSGEDGSGAPPLLVQRAVKQFSSHRMVGATVDRELGAGVGVVQTEAELNASLQLEHAVAEGAGLDEEQQLIEMPVREEPPPAPLPTTRKRRKPSSFNPRTGR